MAEVEGDLGLEHMKPDVGLVVAVQRNQTGADIHTVNNLLHIYINRCYLNDHTLADRAKHELMSMLVAKEWNDLRVSAAYRCKP
jgi:hypothetical protein